MSKYTPKTRPGFMIYHEDLNLMANLEAEEFKTVLLALCAYSQALIDRSQFEMPVMTGWAASIVSIMKHKIDRDHAEYADKCAKNAAVRRRSTNVDERRPGSTNSNSNSSGNSSGNRNRTSSSNSNSSATGEGAEMQALSAPGASPEAPQSTPPSLQEVSSFCKENGLKVDPLRFVSFYASKGWMVGSQPMQDWRAAARTWDRRERETPPPPTDAAPPPRNVKQVEQQQYSQRTYVNSEATLDRMMAEYLAQQGAQT